MDPSSQTPCPFCAAGVPHPPPPVGLLTVRGSRMRHGGHLHIPGTDLVIASDNWVKTRCRSCGAEAMTPGEALDDLRAVGYRVPQDGVVNTTCQDCVLRAAFGHDIVPRRQRGRRGRAR